MVWVEIYILLYPVLKAPHWVWLYCNALVLLA